MVVTVSFRPSPLISTPTYFKVYRKANFDTVEDSFLETSFTEQPGLLIDGSPLVYYFTDNSGEDEFWYRVQTCDDNQCAPMGPPLPGHGNSSFCKLACGVSFLSAFQPGSVTVDELWRAEHDATWFVVEEFLRNKFALRTLLDQFLDPLPQVRLATETYAAMMLLAAYRPHDNDQFEKIKMIFEKTAGKLGLRKEAVSHELTEKTTTRDNLGSLKLDFGR